MADVAVIILTFNEEKHIERALESIRGFASQIFVVDSFSTDRTVELARAGGATVVQHAFINQARQFNWALDILPVTAQWTMRLDADEVIEPDLAREIESRLDALDRGVAGVTLDRKHIFLDRWIRHGGRYPLTMLRIWRTGQGSVEDRWMDEHVVLHGGGAIVAFKGGFADHNLNDLTYFTQKHNGYATREAIEILLQRIDQAGRGTPVEELSAQARTKRWVKTRIYNRLPFWAGPLAYFLYRYVFQFGFLDGAPGVIYHFLQGFWYRFLVGAKVYEFERDLASYVTRDAKIGRLSELTGTCLSSSPVETASAKLSTARVLRS